MSAAFWHATNELSKLGAHTMITTPTVKQRALNECADAIATLDGLRDATSNQVLWLGLLAARQRVETEQRFWEDQS